MIFFVLANISNSFAAKEVDLNIVNNKLQTLTKPIEIYNIEQWRDGGSVFVGLMCSNGERFDFWLNRNSTYPIGRLFITLTSHVEDQIVIPKGSELEKQIVSVLKEWLDLKIDPIEYQRNFPNQKYSDKSLLARHRYYVGKIIESVEVFPTLDIFGAVPIDGNREKQNAEVRRFEEAIKKLK